MSRLTFLIILKSNSLLFIISVFIFIFAEINTKGLIMTTINTANISPVDALWALYQSQSKANKKKFRSLLAAEDALKEEAVKAVCYVSLSSKAEKEMREGKTVHFENAADAQRWMDEL